MTSFSKNVAVCSLLLLACTLAGPTLSRAQTGARTFVASPQALGMGGAAVAVPAPRTALFYNPAHLNRIEYKQAPITMLGGSLSFSSNFRRQHRFYTDRLQPALDDGLEHLSEAQLQALYDEVLQHGQTPALLSGEVLLPSFVINKGTHGFGGGLFAHSEASYTVRDPGSGVPEIDFTALADLMAVAAGSVDLTALGLEGLSAGVTAKYAQRYLTIKTKALDAIDYDHESFYVLGASAVVADLGLLYEPGFLQGPGRLFFGAAWSDLALKDFDYAFSAYWEQREAVQDDAAIASEVSRAQARYQVRPTLRAGVAYVHPSLGGPLGETTVALDYVKQPGVGGTSQPGHVSLGMQTRLGQVLSVRTGLKRGYTTLGAGLDLRPLRIEYAYYTSLQDVVPGQSGTSHHRLEVSLGI